MTRPMLAAPRRILVIDENSDSATSLVYLLEIMGHQALYLSDPRHALTKVDEFRPHAAFVDIALANPDGKSLAMLLRDNYARHELRLIALSVYGDTRIRNKRMTAGFDAYLSKPVKEQDVVTTLGVLFDKRLS